MINNILSTFPQPNPDFKFYWSSRLALWPGREVSKQFQNDFAPLLRLNVKKFNGTETPEQVAHALNHMVSCSKQNSTIKRFIQVTSLSNHNK